MTKEIMNYTDSQNTCFTFLEEKVCNYSKTEVDVVKYDNLDDNIEKAWNFLEETHKLGTDECVCVRALATKTNSWDKFTIPKELVIFRFDKENFEIFKKFMVRLIKAKRIYNFYYNTYKISIRKAKETYEEKGGFWGKTCNVSSTDMIIADFDDFTHEQYLELKKDLEKRGLHGTIDVMSGHGYHIIFKLENKSKDQQLLLKMIKILQEAGYNPDIKCQDAARIMRLPFFFNQKPTKYNTASLAEVITSKSRTFSIEEIFTAFGYDYNTFKLEKYYKEKKKAGRPKAKKDIKITCNEDVDLYEEFKDFNINIDELPIGIKNMMKGFLKGYSNVQTMILTVFFKSNGYELEDIQKIVEKVETINGNLWNDWDVSEEVDRFYYQYNYINKYLLMDMEQEFGDIRLNYDKKNMFKIPIGVMEPGLLKLYAYLLVNENAKKKDILKALDITNNTLDTLRKHPVIIYENRNYNINKSLEFEHYIYVQKELLNNILSLSKNQFSIYCYLYYRMGLKNEIKTSIQSISKTCLMSEKTVSNNIQELEKLNKITVVRSKYDSKTNNKESNIYKFIK